MENRRDEQGGVVSFLVVALALSALLIGGIFLMKNQARTASSSGGEVAVTAPEKNDAQTQPNEESSESEPAPQPTPAPAPTQNTPATTTPSPGTTPAPAPATTQTPAASSAATTNRVANTGPSYGEEVAGALPSTGLEDAIAPLFAFAGLGAGAYIFTESQRKMRLSALK